MIFRELIDKRNERPVKDVPAHIIIILIIAFLCQITWSSSKPLSTINIKKLPEPPSQIESQLFGLGDSIMISKIFMLWLQAFDNQPGVSVPFKNLDYGRVINWLERILALDPKGQYPLLAAGRIYGAVADDEKNRQMLAFIYEQFPKDPNQRWPSMTHAIYIAKHRIKDYPLALKFAHAVAQQVTANNIPSWVKQMEIYVLEDMGEIESAKILIGGLLESGAITDDHELQFLQDRLDRLERENDTDKPVIP
ncbi:MAG: hypothetical protein IH836_00750 [Proteobacteria bacterium]|nr:hypothetical protein [Pseudomonadota bacterium]